MEDVLATLLAPAKINVHLGIYPGRDERGYHRADSVMVCVGLTDEVRICRSEALSLTMSADVGVPQEKNTAFRGARALCDALGRSEGYAIHIEKRIPAQSGMGGASSDAAAVLRGLCELWDMPATDERVVAVARSIGADVPFFLTGNPAYLTGAGDVLVESFPALPEVPVVLVRPDAGVSTVEAYRTFDADPTEPADVAPMCQALRAGDAVRVVSLLYNNLEPAANQLAPATAEVHTWLAAQAGVLGAQLTGSGSCVFAFCESASAAERIAHDAREIKKWWASATKTVGAGDIFC